jgi:ABC-type bacteriocin/lantibiotic exporter with double-glycine peptidase domain
LEKKFRGSLPIENDDWQVGAIVGRSGSGKTTIAKQLFPELM